MSDYLRDEIAHKYNADYYSSRWPNCTRAIHSVIERDGIHISGLEKTLGLMDNPDDNLTVIYAADHKSELDYFLLARMFHDEPVRIPRILGGNNLLIPGISKDLLPFVNSSLIDFRRSGMISIDRKAYKHAAYKQAFDNYMYDFFENECADLLFFPGGGRSYDGRLKRLKEGIIRMIFNSQERFDQNYVIVPISLSYDRVAEDWSFPDQKKIKKRKNIIYHKIAFVADIITGIKHWWNEPKGHVHVDFGDPIFVGQPGMKVDDLVGETYNQLANMTRVTPTALVASCFRNGGSVAAAMSFSQLLEEMEKKLDALPDSVPISEFIANRSMKEIAERGIMFLTKGRNHPGLMGSKFFYKTDNMTLINYYANNIIHHLAPEEQAKIIESKEKELRDSGKTTAHRIQI
jgi:glycerol-3-phosphate O-acyltransferase